MNLEKAIELNENICSFMKEEYESEDRKAVKLGIEALTRLNKMRHGSSQPIYYLLPSETKE